MKQTKEQIAELIKNGDNFLPHIFNADGTARTKFGKYDFPHQFAYFSRNRFDFQGTITLLEVNRLFVIEISFDNGDAFGEYMDDPDTRRISYEVFSVNDDASIAEIIEDLANGYENDINPNLTAYVSNTVRVNPKDFDDSGDIRSYIALALEDFGYAEKHAYGDCKNLYNPFIEIYHKG